MKIAVTCQGATLSDNVDPRFGRCANFLIVDSETHQFDVVDNRAVDLSSGAGIQAAQKIVDAGADVVLTGNCGPKAFRVLATAGIQVCPGASGSVQDALNAFASGSLKAVSEANVSGHFGSI